MIDLQNLKLFTIANAFGQDLKIRTKFNGEANQSRKTLYLFRQSMKLKNTIKSQSFQFWTILNRRRDLNELVTPEH